MNPEEVGGKNEGAFRVLLVAAGSGLAVVFVYALQFLTEGKTASVLSVGVMAAGASLLVGGILGFLFGIPRTLQEERQSAETTDGAMTRGRELPVYRANTNLEQISDWLTKILVGVGLTQIATLPSRLDQLATYLASGLGGSPASAVFGVALVTYYLACGFLIGYLWTRLFLASALLRADMTSEIDRLRNESNQGKVDATALNLVQRHLHWPEGTSLPTAAQVQALKEAIKAASATVKTQIFYQASDFRSNHWQDAADKPKMERTIPVFEALIESDTENQYYQNHGQLGFALKDKPEPDWARAEAELTKAINMRRSRGEGGWLFYEFNRAICRIMQDPEYKEGKESSTSNKERTLTDLTEAAQGGMLPVIESDGTLQDWLNLNHIDPDDLAD